MTLVRVASTSSVVLKGSSSCIGLLLVAAAPNFSLPPEHFEVARRDRKLLIMIRQMMEFLPLMPRLVVRAHHYPKHDVIAVGGIPAEEYSRLLEAVPEYLRAIIILAANTGMRREEILSLKWVE